jgi:hypothetical protein
MWEEAHKKLKKKTEKKRGNQKEEENEKKREKGKKDKRLFGDGIQCEVEDGFDESILEFEKKKLQQDRDDETKEGSVQDFVVSNVVRHCHANEIERERK